MNVDQNFLNNLGFIGGWNIETINNQNFYTLRNPIYCQIFWLRYWHDIGSQNFKNQDFIVQLHDGILTHKVILNPRTGELVQTPLGWTLVAYLGSRPDIPQSGYIQHNINGHVILILYFISLLIVVVILYKPSAKKDSNVARTKGESQGRVSQQSSGRKVQSA